MAEHNENQPKRDMTWREFFFWMAVVAAVMVIICWRKVVYFYYVNYEDIHLVGYALGVALCGLFYIFYCKKTKDIEENVERLSPLWGRDCGILVGRSTEAKVNLYVSDEARLGQVQILGATGKGKTKSVIESWIIRDLKRLKSAILIDGKGDPEIVEHLRRAIRHLGLPHEVRVFDLGNSETSCTMNPIGRGSAQQITDRIFTALEFEDPFYRSVQYRACGALTALLQANAESSAEGSVTFRMLYDCLTSADALSAEIARCKSPTLRDQAARLLHQEGKERDKQMQGLISQLEPLAIGEVAPLVNGRASGRPLASLSEVVLSPETPTLLVLLIPTLKYQAIGYQLGKCFLQELAWAVGERASLGGSSQAFTPVFLDEFSAFVYPGFQNILNKARSSRVALHLSHQSTGDLAIVDPELARIINANTNVKCLLGLNDPVTADFFAKHLGTETEQKRTERARKQGILGGTERTGDYSIREVEAYRIHPNRLKNYSRGMGVLHVPTEHGNVTEEIQFARLCDKDLESPWEAA